MNEHRDAIHNATGPDSSEGDFQRPVAKTPCNTLKCLETARDELIWALSNIQQFLLLDDLKTRRPPLTQLLVNCQWHISCATLNIARAKKELI